MKNTHNTITRSVALATVLCGSVASSQAAVLAFWDDWAGTTTYAADSTTTGFAATASVVGSSRINTGFGSTDGDFGDDLAGAASTLTTGVLVRGRDDQDVVTIALTNTTGMSYDFNSIHFDYGMRSQSGNAFTLAYTSGGLGADGTTIGSASGLTAVVGGSQSGAEGNGYYQYDFGLATPLSDITLGTGETATFTLTFTGDTSTGSSGVFDNLAIQGTVAVPEPSSTALIGLGGLALILRP